MQTQRWAGEIFADYNQFCLWDSGRCNQAPVDYTDEDVRRRIKTGEHVVVIQPERNFTVPVAIEIHEAEPPVDEGDWDHIVEASLHLPTGALQVHECTGGVITDFKVPPGWYRLRSLHANLATVDGVDGDDHYRIVVWPAPEGPVVVIKQFEGGAAATEPNGSGNDMFTWYPPADPTPREVCPCCDYVSLAERGNYLICPVCFWEDDGQDVDQLDRHSGPNHITLREGRANFERFGACDERAVQHVCLPEERAGFERQPRRAE